MRCKVGDLVVYVGRHLCARGRMTSVVGPCPWRDDSWRVEPTLARTDGLMCEFITDAALRPIRDNDGQDETLTWKERETA